MTQQPITPIVDVSVVKTNIGQQITRATISVVMALGALLTFVSTNQQQIQTLFPNVKWIGAALLAGGLVARMLQEILLAFNIHVVPGVKR